MFTEAWTGVVQNLNLDPIWNFVSGPDPGDGLKQNLGIGATMFCGVTQL